jgi:Na+-translocating ferredoxin:NAD+ oxidoreductase RnfA subunit
MSGIRERLELCSVPEPLKDYPLVFILAAIMSLSFAGFNAFKF